MRWLLLLMMAVVLSITHANAYIDPGTASVVWQILLATGLGVLYAVKVKWNYIKLVLQKNVGKSQ